MLKNISQHKLPEIIIIREVYDTNLFREMIFSSDFCLVNRLWGKQNRAEGKYGNTVHKKCPLSFVQCSPFIYLLFVIICTHRN